jgi:hypothetical protein
MTGLFRRGVVECLSLDDLATMSKAVRYLSIVFSSRFLFVCFFVLCVCIDSLSWNVCDCVCIYV